MALIIFVYPKGLLMVWRVIYRRFLSRLGLFYAMKFDPEGIKWKLKIYSLIWHQNFTKNFIFTTIEMATKNATYLLVYFTKKSINF